MKEMPLTKGKIVILDDEDYEIFKQYKYCARGDKDGRFYAMRRYTDKETGKSVYVYLHREIIKPKDGNIVDHINGNTLDCRRCNLREVTSLQNTLNGKLRKSLGVVLRNRKRKYYVYIRINGKKTYIGCYMTIKEAQNAYLKAERKRSGIYSPQVSRAELFD